MTPRIAIVDNSVMPDLYRPVEHWAAYLPPGWEAFRAPDGELPDLARGYTHLILTGSEASILEREPWADREVDFVQEAQHRGLAILGSCWGHQLIALALAGPAHVGRAREPEIGWVAIDRFVATELLGPPGAAFSFSIHYDEVRNLEEPFVVVAGTEICPVQAFGLKGGRVWGLQIHPEIDPPAARVLLAGLVVRGLDPTGLCRRALDLEPRDSGLIRRIVEEFLAISLDKAFDLDIL